MAKTKRSGLGKGLDSLIPIGVLENTKEADVENEGKESFLKLSAIEPNRDQPRKVFDETALKELADSIKQFGIIQPLIVQKRDNYYEIVAGERRWRAAKLAGLKEVPVIIKQYNDQELMEISLIENIQRENLNPIEEAEAYYRLLDEFGLKHEEIAERVSKSRAAITNIMRLLKLPEEIRQMIIEGLLSNGHARALLSLESKEIQIEAAIKVVEDQLSVRETEKLVKKLLSPARPKQVTEEESEAEILIYKGIESRLKELLGTKVSIQKKNQDKGKIEIEYYSIEELERILDFMEEHK